MLRSGKVGAAAAAVFVGLAILAPHSLAVQARASSESARREAALQTSVRLFGGARATDSARDGRVVFRAYPFEFGLSPMRIEAAGPKAGAAELRLEGARLWYGPGRAKVFPLSAAAWARLQADVADARSAAGGPGGVITAYDCGRDYGIWVEIAADGREVDLSDSRYCRFGPEDRVAGVLIGALRAVAPDCVAGGADGDFSVEGNVRREFGSMKRCLDEDGGSARRLQPDEAGLNAYLEERLRLERRLMGEAGLAAE